MSIFRSTNPADFDDVDGIIINESAPSPNIQGAPSNVAIMVAQTARGLTALTDVGSIGEFHQLYGKSSTFGGNIALKNKKFGRLRVIRVDATGAAAAAKTFNATATPIITFTAKQGKGAYGNSIKVTIAAGSSSGKKYTIQDTDPNAVLPDEVYDNVAVASVVANATFAGSSLVTATVVATSAEPDNIAATALIGGLDGTASDTDYQTAIALAAVEGAGNFLFLDSYNTTRNGYLKQHASDTQDKMVLVAGQQTDSVATAVTDAGLNRDVDGRIIYCYPWVQTSIDGVLTMTSPAAWMASILSQTNPSVDPARAQSTQFLGGVTGLQLQLTRANYITLLNAGIAAFEYDQDLGGYKPKSGIVTQLSDSSKLTILRRRMADFLTQSAGKFLKNYQNAVNSKANRAQVKGAFLNFIQSQEANGVLPRDNEVKSGKAKIVDTESLNTDTSIAAGLFKILWRQRIYSSMRFIVLQAEIGQSVVVTEGQ